MDADATNIWRAVISLRLVAAVALLCLGSAACRPTTADSTADSTAAPPAVGSTATPPAAGSTPADGASFADRQVNEVACDEAAEPAAIVCEAYELIQTHYVDDVADGDLAAGAAKALRSLDGADAAEPMTCALPSAAFKEACDIAAETADDTMEAAEAIVAGMAGHALDRNSAYFNEGAVELLDREEEGTFEGIGAIVSPEDRTIEGDDKLCKVMSETCRILIVSTIDGAPAEAAGLQRDDAIARVDGESIIGWTVDEVTSRVRGPAGTEVTLTVERDGATFDVSVRRAAVVIPVIESERFDDTGYIRLRVFSGNADEQLAEALTELLAEEVGRLIVDLRDNPGGLLNTAIAVASAFMSRGDVVVTQSPDGAQTYSVTGDSIVPDDIELVFVVNKGSASASEVVSAVLRENERITLVGESTFGKNTVQQRFGLSNGGAVKLTIARWLTPAGLDFGGAGVTPDVQLDVEDLAGLDAAALVEAVLAAA